MIPRRARITVLAASFAAAALALVRAGPPAPAATDAPAEQFSAERARATLAELLGDQAPHPVGSPQNAVVRGRLVAHLRGLGLQPEEQRSFACSEAGSCAFVTNVITWLPGQVSGPALALLSHHDSVPAGPGAADDGHGVALVLEALRALRDAPRRNPLVAIFTDGEEAGLLGARAFVEDPRAAEIAVVLNAEARGTTGASRMFETSDGNAGLIAAYAAGAPRPSAQSLSYEIYRRLPNDTDLTIFKRHGVQGMNFAFIGGVQRYHTPRDDLAHLDLGSVQQQGDALLAAARGLLAADLSARSEHNTSYIDLLGAVLLRWPAWLDLPLAALALLIVIVAALRRVALRRLAAAAVTTLVAPVLGAAAGFAALRLVEALSGPLGPWPASSPWALLTAASAASALVLATLRVVTRRTDPLAQALGTWLVWALLALVLARVIPGASILFLGPALLAALVVAAPQALGRRSASGAAAVAPGALALALVGAFAVALWTPLVPALAEALGLSGVFVGVLVGWSWTALSPACAKEQGQKTLAYGACLFMLVAVAFGVVTAVAPRVDADHPAKLNLLHLTDLDTNTAVHVADAPGGELPAAVRDALPWGEERPVLPWAVRPMPTAPAEPISAEGPTLTPAAEPGKMLLRARPGALAAILVIPEGAVSSLSIEGRALDPGSLRHGPGDTRFVTIYGPPPGGVRVAATVARPASWRLVDATSGLPPGSPASRRPDSHVPFQWGDLTLTTRVHSVE